MLILRLLFTTLTRRQRWPARYFGTGCYCWPSIGLTKNRKVAFILDNIHSHCTIDNILSLLNVELIVFPANTSAQLQTVDAEIMAPVKKRYLRNHAQSSLHVGEEHNFFDRYKVGLSTGISLLWKIWDGLWSKIIYCSRYSTWIVGSDDSRESDAMQAEDE